ncbi:MAG: deoxyguanosinetriphosphate triphosphohydrolase [Actinomycetales bacterium]|nr:deoxyguanosinetriphosphate triphosphohydrolase [Actinomycetales bacterium]
MSLGFDRSVFERGYSDFDRERFVPETRTGASGRGEFARDRARVVHSAALRRLGAKTQVLSPSGGDFARTRLTHSLEVAQIGREMALDLGVSPDLVDMACLAHDLGHPPFGHNGEKALNIWAEGIGGFEGNAQTLRLLTRIEPKVSTREGLSVGLNLTRASLDAACKYPWSLADASAEKGADHSLKFGVYEDDLPIFEWMRIGAPAMRKSVEAQIMDFADDVAYSVHDFEDAIVSRYVDVAQLNDAAYESELLTKIAAWNGFSIEQDELRQALERLQTETYWLREYVGSTRDLGQLKNLTSALIGRFVSRTTSAIIDDSPAESLARFGAILAVPREVRAEIAVLKGIVSAFLMSHERRQPFYERQRIVLVELADALLAANGRELDAYSSAAWLSAKDESAQRRVIVDQVASLTDQSAIALHERLVGPRG